MRALTALLALALALGDQPANKVAIPEVEERGVGRHTLLLVGCMSCRWQTWETFMERNKDRYRMMAVTLPGFGGTPVPPLPTKQPGRIWQDAALRALDALLAARNVDKVIVLGHSFGRRPEWR